MARIKEVIAAGAAIGALLPATASAETPSKTTVFRTQELISQCNDGRTATEIDDIKETLIRFGGSQITLEHVNETFTDNLGHETSTTRAYVYRYDLVAQTVKLSGLVERIAAPGSITIDAGHMYFNFEGDVYQDSGPSDYRPSACDITLNAPLSK